jgi:hypothetical protein
LPWVITGAYWLIAVMVCVVVLAVASVDHPAWATTNLIRLGDSVLDVAEVVIELSPHHIADVLGSQPMSNWRALRLAAHRAVPFSRERE